jgi:hypothetical protein
MAAIVISKQWDGAHTSTRAAVVTFALEKSGDISILIDAPFHNDPAPSAPVGPCLDLINHELIQVFVGIGEFPVAPEGEKADYSGVQYLELGVGPHGHFYARMFSGEANFALCDSQLQFPAPKVMINSSEDCWNSEIRIPVSYVPEPEYHHTQNSLKWMINAFASHGGLETEANRETMALSPLPGPEKNLHQLACFVPVVLKADMSSSAAPLKTVFRRGSGALMSVNLNEVDGDSLSEDESDADGERPRGSTEGGGEEDSENMRMYRILSGIAEERETDAGGYTRPSLALQGSSQSGSHNINGVRVPSKDWYTINRENDPDAPPTLGSFTEQYRGKVRLEPKFHRYMNDDEFPLMHALIWKRKGWSHKERMLILTSKPRLFYLDEKGKYKGTIPWTSAEQIGASKVSSKQFDVSQGTSDRVYHFTDKENGADKWVELINAVVNVWRTNIEYEKSKPRNSMSDTPPPVAGAPSTPSMARLRSGSSAGSAGHGGANQSPLNSQNSGSAVVPQTVTEMLEKYRRPPREGEEREAFLGGIPLKHEAMFMKFIHPDEFVILQGYVHKQQGFLPKKRVLILTSKPRLLYLKRDGTFVGTIAWSMTTPIAAKKVRRRGLCIIIVRSCP